MNTPLYRRAIVLVALVLAASAHADTPPSGPASAPETALTVREQLELAVAQVCVNEAGFTRLRDCSLIWQTVTRFRTDEARLAYLRRHSCRVLGQQYCTRPRPCPEDRNCQWSQYLTTDDVAPQGWPADARFPARSWRRLREHVRRLVAGHEPLPCDGRPITWGGAMDADNAAAQGLVALDCGETRNTGYARAPR